MSAVSVKRRTINQARVRLWQAIDRACIARGEAQWTNGYRVGAGAGNDENLYEKERRQWAECGAAERSVERAIRHHAFVVRRF